MSEYFSLRAISSPIILASMMMNLEIPLWARRNMSEGLPYLICSVLSCSDVMDEAMEEMRW